MDRNEAKSILKTCQYELSNQIGSEWCRKKYEALQEAIKALEEPEQEWIPCSKQLPKIGQPVLLSTTHDRTLSGYLEKPTTMYLVFDDDKNKEIWVYDPESYTYAYDFLPKAEDCSFSDSSSGNGFLSVTSMNYDPRFEGVTAWMPHPRPYQGWKISEKETERNEL